MISKWDNRGIRPRDLLTARFAENAEEAQGICERLVAGGLAEWRKDKGKRAKRLYLLSTQQSAGQEAA